MSVHEHLTEGFLVDGAWFWTQTAPALDAEFAYLGCRQCPAWMQIAPSVLCAPHYMCPALHVPRTTCALHYVCPALRVPRTTCACTTCALHYVCPAPRVPRTTCAPHYVCPALRVSRTACSPHYVCLRYVCPLRASQCLCETCECLSVSVRLASVSASLRAAQRVSQCLCED